MRHRIIVLAVVLIAGAFAASAQSRIAVLPFRNLDGDIQYNLWSMQFADSLRSALLAASQASNQYYVVPADSVEATLASLNLDPTSPSYESDTWKALRILNVNKTVRGSFQLVDERVLIDCYIYDMTSMQADQTNKAEGLYRKPTNYLDAIKAIVKRISPGL